MPPHAAAATQAWAFATCSRDDSVDARLQKQLFDNIARAAYKRLDRFSDQGLSNLAWAFAAAGEAQRHEKLFGAVASEAAPRVAEFQPQGFSNLAWCVMRCLSFADERDGVVLIDAILVPPQGLLDGRAVVLGVVYGDGVGNCEAEPRRALQPPGNCQHRLSLREERRGLEAVVRLAGHDDVGARRQERRRPDEGGLHAAGACTNQRPR